VTEAFTHGAKVQTASAEAVSDVATELNRTQPADPRQPRATRLIFFVLGSAAGGWAPLVPFAKSRLALDDGTLGLLLLCLGVGSIIAMPIAGALAGRVGCRRVLLSAAVAAACAFPWLALAAAPVPLGVALFVFGAAIGSMDCVVNIQAIAVERERGRPMMSGFHALYSLGGVAGAGAVSGMVALGVSAPIAAFVVAIGLLTATLVAWPGLLARRDPGGGLAFRRPHGVVVLIGIGCFILFLAEGSALDWSAVLLRTVRGAPAAEAGLAYAAFSAAMTTGRLIGDRLVARLGLRRTVVAGALTAALGLTLAALAPSWELGVAAYAVLGGGCANIVPALFTLTGRQTAMPESAAVAAVSVLGYAGILAGPAAIGLAARATTLPTALLGIAALLLLVCAGATRLPD
jgi:predicted MFS family arabinose efflux permease